MQKRQNPLCKERVSVRVFNPPEVADDRSDSVFCDSFSGLVRLPHTSGYCQHDALSDGRAVSPKPEPHEIQWFFVESVHLPVLFELQPV